MVLSGLVSATRLVLGPARDTLCRTVRSRIAHARKGWESDFYAAGIAADVGRLIRQRTSDTGMSA